MPKLGITQQLNYLCENDESMSDVEKIQLFENKKVRTAWDEEKQEWFFSIVDVCGILTDQPTHERARNYWKVLKNRLKKEGRKRSGYKM